MRRVTVFHNIHLVMFRRPCLVPCVLILALWSATANATEPFWLADHAPTDQAVLAVRILSHATADGLDPDAYGTDTFAQVIDDAQRGQLTPERALAFEHDLTLAMEHYLHDLHFGRVTPESVQEKFTGGSHSDFNATETLKRAVRTRRLEDEVAAAAPRLPLYPALRQALAQYRTLAAHSPTAELWKTELPPLPTPKIEPGQSYAGLPLAARRLAALGDLPSHATATTAYTEDIAEGIRQFQRRHGLNADGVIGRRTHEQLNVHPGTRVRQIELTMERARWTPLMQAKRMIAVNVPENELEAYEVEGDTINVKTRMRVISGNAPDQKTPIFDGVIRTIEFRPYWNVPISIARREIAPMLLSNPDTFRWLGFEFIFGEGIIGDKFAEEALDEVLRGRVRLRQRPGPGNPMGDVKFIIPDRDGIYLHHTDTPQLFRRESRNLSHGCIRVEDPVALAQFAINADEWDEKRIRTALDGQSPTLVRLPRPLPVIITYMTVRVKNDGLIYFFPDVYGQDTMLDQALRRVSTPAS